jgi:hypothetical protein
METKYYRARLIAFGPGVNGHVVVKIEGDKVTTLAKVYVTEDACNKVVSGKNEQQAAK